MTERRIPGQAHTVSLPPNLLDNMRMVHGRSNVDTWLEELPQRLATILAELDAEIVPGDPPLSYHLVLFAEQRGGKQIVVKTTVPNHEQPPELAAVRAFSDAGIGPKLLWHDLQRGTLVMERVTPGHILPTNLPTLEEDAQLARTLAELSKVITFSTDVARWKDDLVPVAEYSRAIIEVDPASELWSMHQHDITFAQELRDKMLAEGHSVVLHGDLHHYNVLTDEADAKRIIDPKGLVGPPGYDFGAFTYNPVGIQHHPDLATIERQRIDIWSQVTGVEWETVRQWGYVAAILSACWSGNGGAIAWADAMKVAITLRDLDPPLSSHH